MLLFSKYGAQYCAILKLLYIFLGLILKALLQMKDRQKQPDRIFLIGFELNFLIALI